MEQIAIFQIPILQYLKTILSSCHPWRLRVGQNSCVHALVPFLPRYSNRAENFLLSWNLICLGFDRFRWANGCSSCRSFTVLVLVFCMAVTAAGEGSECPKAEFMDIHCLHLHPVSTSKLNWFKRD